MWYWAIFVLISINIVAFIVMGIDKYKAKKGKRRVPEKWLLLFPILGGAFGFVTSMIVFKHKLSKVKFIWGATLATWVYFLAMSWKLLQLLK